MSDRVSGGGEGRNGPRTRPAGDGERALAFGVSAAALTYLGLADGGYDIVTRQGFFASVWAIVALGFAFGLLPRARLPRGARLAGAGAAALSGAIALSFSWTPSDERTLAELARLLGYAGVVTLAWSALGPRTWRAAAAGVLLAALVVCAVALGGRLAPSLAPLSAAERALGSDRLFAPLGYWNSLAAWAAAAAAMALAWSADARRVGLRAAALAAVPLCLLVNYLTYSRGGAVELALGVGVVIALSRNRERAAVHALAAAALTLPAVLTTRGFDDIARGEGTDGAAIVLLVLLASSAACWIVGRATSRLANRPPGTGGTGGAPAASRPLAAAAAAGVVALALAGLVAGAGGFGHGGDGAAVGGEGAVAADPAERLASSASNRSAYWAEALDAFADEPLRGIGAGTFEYRWATSTSEPELVADAHSLVFETLAELGLLGAVSLACAVAGLAIAAARGVGAARGSPAASAMAAAFAIYLLAAAIDWMWEATALSALGLGSAAIVAMAGRELRPRRRRPGGLGRSVGARATIAVVLAAVVVAAAQVPGAVSVERARDAEASLARGGLEAGLEQADDAVTAAPWAATPYAVRAEVELARGAVEAARVDAQAAASREPLEPSHRFLLAAVEVERGEPEAAAAQLERARSLSPLSIRLTGAEVEELVARIERLRARADSRRAP